MRKKDTNLLLVVGIGAAVYFIATRKPELTDAEKAEIKRKHRSM